MSSRPCRTCGSNIYFVDIRGRPFPFNSHDHSEHLKRERCRVCSVEISVHVKSDGSFSAYDIAERQKHRHEYVPPLITPELGSYSGSATEKSSIRRLLSLLLKLLKKTKKP